MSIYSIQMQKFRCSENKSETADTDGPEYYDLLFC